MKWLHECKGRQGRKIVRVIGEKQGESGVRVRILRSGEIKDYTLPYLCLTLVLKGLLTPQFGLVSKVHCCSCGQSGCLRTRPEGLPRLVVPTFLDLAGGVHCINTCPVSSEVLHLVFHDVLVGSELNSSNPRLLQNVLLLFYGTFSFSM